MNRELNILVLQGLTDKQQKQADRIRRNENRLANLQREYDAISVQPSLLSALLVAAALQKWL